MVGQAEEELKKDPAVADYTSVVGLNFIDNYSQANAAFIVLTLKPFEERPGSENSVNAMMPRLSEKFREIGGGIVLALAPPPIVGLGIGDGFTCVFEDLQGRSPQALAQVAGPYGCRQPRPEAFARFQHIFRREPSLRRSSESLRYRRCTSSFRRYVSGCGRLAGREQPSCRLTRHQVIVRRRNEPDWGRGDLKLGLR